MLNHIKASAWCSLGFRDCDRLEGKHETPREPCPPSLQVRVVVKEPKGREVNDGDSFSFNQAFSEKLYRIKINSIQLKETVEENKKTNDQVLQDRQYQVWARA